jgi:hypothetical protein
MWQTRATHCLEKSEAVGAGGVDGFFERGVKGRGEGAALVDKNVGGPDFVSSPAE